MPAVYPGHHAFLLSFLTTSVRVFLLSGFPVFHNVRMLIRASESPLFLIPFVWEKKKVVDMYLFFMSLPLAFYGRDE